MAFFCAKGLDLFFWQRFLLFCNGFSSLLLCKVFFFCMGFLFISASVVFLQEVLHFLLICLQDFIFAQGVLCFFCHRVLFCF